jgi:hypothetical protein
VAEYGLALTFHVLVETDAWPSLGQDHLKGSLAALQRIRPEIVAVQFDQVEGVKENAFIMVAVADTIERSDALPSQATASPSMIAGTRAQAGQCLHDQRETIGEVVAGTAVELHLCALLAGDDPKAIVFDLMQPLAACGQLIGFGWETRRDEPGRERTLQHRADS